MGGGVGEGLTAMVVRTGWAGRGGARLSAVVLLVAVLVGLVPLTVGAQQTVPAQTPLSRAEPKLGRASATQSVSVTLPLVTDTAALDAFLARVVDPRSPDYHHFLSPAEFTARFVDSAGRRDVVAFLQNAGLDVHDSGTGVTISASGDAAKVERAFSVQLDSYRAANGRDFVAADRTAALPSNVAARVRGVVGLDTPHPRTPHLVPAPLVTDAVSAPVAPNGSRAVSSQAATGCPGATNAAQTHNAFTPNQLATAYNFDALRGAGYQGEGQTVALFELADYDDANVTTWKNCFGLTTPVSRVVVGQKGALGVGTGQEEVELDIDIITGLAPKLAQLLVYETGLNTDAGVLDEYQRIATDNIASVVSTSWGVCEAGNSTAATMGEDAIFAQMAAQGMTVFAASGDNGTNDCGSNPLSPGYNTVAVDDPASQPYVSGVGGTRLTVSGANAYTSESIWNSGGSGGGGGISAVWPRASWQTGPGVANSYTNGFRQVPDVSADADPGTGYVVFALGAWRVYGGTSAGAPLWAAGTALMNQRLTAGGESRVGFGNPVWYRLLAQSPTTYHDVTAGNNCVFPSPCAPNTYPATAGYDQASGVGSPNFDAIATALIDLPVVSGLSSSSGPTNGNTPVTITGSNLNPGIIVTFGGQASPTVTWISDTQIIAIIPAHASGVVTVTVRNPGHFAVVTAATSYTYVAPTPQPAPTAPPATPGSVPNVAPVNGNHPAATPSAATPLPQPARH